MNKILSIIIVILACLCSCSSDATNDTFQLIGYTTNSNCNSIKEDGLLLNSHEDVVNKIPDMVDDIKVKLENIDYHKNSIICLFSHRSNYYDVERVEYANDKINVYCHFALDFELAFPGNGVTVISLPKIKDNSRIVVIE